MKKKTIISLLSLCAIFGLLTACGSGKKKQANDTRTTEMTHQSTTESASSTIHSDVQLDLKGMQQIGKEGYGYLYVPDNWLPFTDLDGSDTYQYTREGYNIVTLYSYTKEDLAVEKIDQLAVKNAATSYYYGMESSNIYENLTASMSEVAGREAYQVYGTVKSDGKILCAWFFKTEKNDKVYLVSLEGDKETLNQVLPYIEGTWTATK